MQRGDPRIRELVASVAGRVGERLASVTGDIQDVIEQAIPGLQGDESAALLHASIGENVDVALEILTDAGARTVAAPAAAVDYARRLAQQDVPATVLIRAYRVGQARLLRHCIEELLRQSPGDHLEGMATLEMAESVSAYVDHVVEEVLTTYATARDAWLGDRSAVLAMRVREILRGERVDLAATERRLDYRFDQYHLGLVLWVEASDEPDSLPRIRRLVGGLGQDLELAATPLVIPADENSAWAWLPTRASLARTGELALAAKSEPAVTLAVGEPAAGIEGFRRSHRQAVSAPRWRSPPVTSVPRSPPSPTWPRSRRSAPTSAPPGPGSTKPSATWPSPRPATKDCGKRHASSSKPVAATRPPPSSCSSTATPPSTGFARPNKSGAVRCATAGWTSKWPCWPATG